ncbi:MAG TPA: SpvB/TcaC N-terminal domain-containing protein [Thermoanaerobaculia bacterium]|nr:SpvB/TcaC N-terminal domain-containing protein [Thermoanaerobaculia bacterium]
MAQRKQGETSGATSATGRPFVTVSAPTLSLAKGGGAMRGIGEKLSANAVNGTASLAVPLAVSPGRDGFGPQLSLTYDSGAGNGPFGFGWSLALPAISRRTDRRLPRYHDGEQSDVYLFAGSEDLVPVIAADGSRFADAVTAPGYTIHRYRPRIEGLFARIERWSDRASGEVHWRSISRDNVTSRYGRTAESRIADPADPRRVFSWLLCESYDDKGNAIVYRYVAENDHHVDLDLAAERNRRRSANRYLKSIRYGNRVSRLAVPDLAGAEWHFEVIFDYDEGHYAELPAEPGSAAASQHARVRAAAAPGHAWQTRPDSFSSCRAGFEVRTHRRCRRILMFHNFPELGDEPCLVRATELDYDDLDYTRPVAVEAELAHPGSSRLASLLRRVVHSGFVRDASTPLSEVGGVRQVTYRRRSLPALELDYSRPRIDDRVRELDAASLEDLPVGLDGSLYQWVDLDGEGLSGILSEQGGAWFYKPNLGGARFGAQQRLPTQPSLGDLRGGRQQLLDLAGDGPLDLVAFSGPTPGFYERTPDGDWDSFQPFVQLPNVDWRAPELRFLDLDGDGRADLLLTEDGAFTWHASLGEAGFAAAERVAQPGDEERGPRLVLADRAQSIYLADMSGDGLTDLVRIRNGEVCYWPNEGYGRFGPKVTMDDAPWFDRPDRFDQRRIRLADLDGSGVTDVVYLGRDGVRLYFNQAGNRWSAPRSLRQLPLADDSAAMTVVDLLGNGTSCLVWSSPLPAHAGRPLRFVDLMGGRKPHLLVRTRNQLGAETRVDYAPSTKFYLADKQAGRPWITRLPFVVQVVEWITTDDAISGNRFASRFAYHHGHFDGVEREFRGFGLVEQWDSEGSGAGGEPPASNLEAASHVPPVLTRSWFHSGVAVGRQHVADFFAGLLDAGDRGEYYREPGLTDAQARALLLADTELPSGLSGDEEREACRALKGSLLRQEVYALDGSEHQAHPYTVSELAYALSRLQAKGTNPHAVFLCHPRESVVYHYERAPADPRVLHQITLEVDAYGNVLKSARIAYERRRPDPELPAAEDRDRQGERWITYDEQDFTAAVDEAQAWRAPLPCESRTFELTGYAASGPAGRLRAADLVQAAGDRLALSFDVDLDVTATPGDRRQRRLVARERTLYRRDNLSSPLPLGALQSLALPFESYRLALSPLLAAGVYAGRAIAEHFAVDGGYVDLDGDAAWWIPSGRVFYSPGSADSAADELAFARRHFFLPHRYRDPFHRDALPTETAVSYDPYSLLAEETRDPFDNRVTVGERAVDPTQPLLRRGHDYRVLQPTLVMDPNRNCSAVVFDALGLVAGTAVMGKPEASPAVGDRLTASFAADLTSAEVEHFFADPASAASRLLGDATTRIVYDFERYLRQPEPRRKAPVFAATLAGETHVSESLGAAGRKVQITFSYSDGFGREIQKMLPAEPGPVPKRDPLSGRILIVDGRPEWTAEAVSPRWVASGWTVFNNKGKAVRRFEPFFTDSHRFEDEVRIGVSRVTFYDPTERVVGTLHPDHSWEKTVFGAWQQVVWDLNDTLTLDPATDPHLGAFFTRLPAAEYLPTWHTRRADGSLGPLQREAAERAALCAATPAVAHSDALGRAFLTTVHNRTPQDGEPPPPPLEERYHTRVRFDVTGNQREVHDPLNRLVVRHDYDLLGNRIHQASMEAGERWTLNDVAGKPVHSWDSRDHHLRTAYDPLRRPTAAFLDIAGGAELLVGLTTYGEAAGDPEASNHRGRILAARDQAGVVTSVAYDFKGNLLHSRRQLAREYKQTLDWSAAVALEAESWDLEARYDALNRPFERTLPDRTVLRHRYNEANLLAAVAANLRGAAELTPLVTRVEYDARGQRVRLDYATRDGHGVSTTYEHDRDTLRLVRLATRRHAPGFAGDRPGGVQDLHFVHDAVGNLTHLHDESQPTLYFRNRVVAPRASYLYDAVYRLVEASGREHLGLDADEVRLAPRGPTFDGFHGRLDHPADGRAMGTYVERYLYDEVGNILSLHHRGTDPAHAGWRRSYTYGERSQLEADRLGNRLTRTELGASVESYRYDGSPGRHGDVTAMPHLPLMAWDYRDQLQATSRQVAADGGTPEITWYVYDAAGERVRKVTERAVNASAAAAGRRPTRANERLYLGDFELWREYAADGSTVELARETLHVMAGRQRLALVETRTDGGGSTPEIRYQLANHQGSATLELDDEARIVSYEEYYPYGSVACHAVRGQLEAVKRFGYAGRERDAENGLSYHGARYYAPWLGRWVSCDPVGIQDGLSVYVYARDNPTTLSDPTGKYGEAGHYYTVYFVSLAAGFDHAKAARNAVYAQLPDEVRQLDAIEVAEDYGIFGVAAVLTSVAARQRVSAAGIRELSRLKDQLDVVQGGLHALTGGDIATERDLTRKGIAQSAPGSLRFGLLLHRLGDTYAHAEPGTGRMYPAQIGHAWAGKSPDQIHQRPDVYGAYVRDLFAVLSKASRAQGFAPRRENVEDLISAVTSIKVTKVSARGKFVAAPEIDADATERAQIGTIRSLAEKPGARAGKSGVALGALSSYDPENQDPTTFAQYQQRNLSLVPNLTFGGLATEVHGTAHLVGQDRAVELR